MLEKDTNAMTLTFESPADSELPQKNKVFTPSMYDRAKGLLFVGDPHLSQRRPGRRVESDEEILAVTLDKLDQCIALANARHGVVVILGDLFDKSKGNSEKMLTRLFYILRKAEHPVYCLAGNHDLLASEVTDDTALAAVEAAGLIHVIRGQGKWFASFAIEDQRVWCGANLHDEALPRAVARPDEADQVLWFTHHDIAFEGHYPSSLEPHAISGVDWVINGHMHRTQPKVVKERTTWFNPGNIFRQTIADAKHVPSAWWWVPG